MHKSPSDLPTGTVTFLFTDIEGSTALVQRLDAGTYGELLEQHHRLLRAAFASHGGSERGTQGDAFLVVFRDAPSAIAASVAAQRALAVATWPHGQPLRVRMGLHSGEGIAGGDDYVGVDINRAARIAGAAHGGQVLVSEATKVLAERSLPPGVAFRDLGRHRLKDLVLPERLHQLTIQGLRDEFPAVRSLSPALAGFPARTTSFLGRERDLDSLVALLADSRLITLVGPGGTGKTSLATELARRAAERYADGAVFVALEAVADPDLVAPAIVAALGLRDPSPRPARDQLIDNLAEREIMLVLDNLEQLVEVAPLLGELLAAGPRVTVVATSRAALHLVGEQTYPVAPLTVPIVGGGNDPVALAEIDAVRLFVGRARRVLPGFEVTADNAAAVAEICRLLDGLPLGIEIAAARIGLLGPAGIRDRLASSVRLPGSSIRGAPTRQRTMRDAIEWSHDLLDRPGRSLFRRFSVFAGGCRLEEVEAVCMPFAERGAEVVDALASLVDQSLIIVDQRAAGVRYEMLRTISDVAAEHLRNDPDRAALERRHAEVYLAFAEAHGGDRLEGRELSRGFAALSRERGNLGRALRWSIERSVPDVALRLVAALARFWWLAGEVAEAMATVDEVLAMPGAEAATPQRMHALEGAGLIAYYASDTARANAFYERQLELALALGDARGAACARYNMIFTHDYRSDPLAGLAALDAIADAFDAIGDERFVARTDWARATMLIAAGRHAEAARLMEQATGRFDALGDLPYEMQAANSLAIGGLMAGDRQAAARWFPRTLALARELGDMAAVAIALPTFAIAALEFVSPAAAATLMGAYDGLGRRHETRMPLGLAQVVAIFQPDEKARARLRPGEYESAFEAGRAMSIDEVYAFLDETVGQIRERAGEPE